MGKLIAFYQGEPKTGSKFAAFFGDGSGADLFMRDDSGDYMDADGNLLSRTWFEDSGYFGFMYIPNSFRLWFEEQPND